MNTEDKGRPEERVTTLVVAALVVIAVWAISFIVVWWRLPLWAERGQFGDTFGATNALFSGLAFAGVVYALVLQRRELALQRLQLEDTQEQQQTTARTLALQVEIALVVARIEAQRTLVTHERGRLRELAQQGGVDAITRNDQEAKFRAAREGQAKLLEELASRLQKIHHEGVY